MGAGSRGKGGKVAILHGAVAPDAAPDEQDVLVEVETVGAALAALGYRPVPLPLGLDLAAAGRRLARLKPDFVFNLVESLEGQGRLIHLAPSLLDSLGLPIPAAGRRRSISPPTSRWPSGSCAVLESPRPIGPAAGELPGFPGPYIVKSVWEHASIGLEDGSVTGDIGALPALLEERRRRLGGEWFIEAYVEGREFNLSLLGGPQDMQLLPPAEMCFVGYPAGKPRIVNYAAKWDEHSFEFHATPRRFDFGAEDGDLLGRLAATARACWRLFDLRGYARVDCRIDGRGEVQVLEVNINPCLSPDAGFAAAAAQAGLDLPGIVARIIADRARAREPAPCATGRPGSALAAGCGDRFRTGEMTSLVLRDQPGPADLAAVRRLTEASGVFSAVEVELAVELLQERLARGLKASGYHFLFAEFRRGRRSRLCLSRAGAADPGELGSLLDRRRGGGPWPRHRPPAPRRHRAARRRIRGRRHLRRHLRPPRLRPHPRLLRPRRLPQSRRAPRLLRARRGQGDLRQAAHIGGPPIPSWPCSSRPSTSGRASPPET